MTMEWFRTLRVDEPPTGELQRRLTQTLSQEGVVLHFEGSVRLARTYVLVQGPEGVDPADLAATAADARSYPEAIIALAIEPAPADALQPLAQALGGAGRPAGVFACDIAQDALIVEFAPSKTPASTIVAIVDAELRRFSGSRKTELLSPLPAGAYARVAADGLQCPEIAPERVLEELLELPYVE